MLEDQMSQTNANKTYITIGWILKDGLQQQIQSGSQIWQKMLKGSCKDHSQEGSYRRSSEADHIEQFTKFKTEIYSVRHPSHLVFTDQKNSENIRI